MSKDNRRWVDRDWDVWGDTVGGFPEFVKPGAVVRIHKEITVKDVSKSGDMLTGVDTGVFTREFGWEVELVRPAPVVEPTKYAAVVEDVKGVLWSRTGTGIGRVTGGCWRSVSQPGYSRRWADVERVGVKRVVFEGVDQ